MVGEELFAAVERARGDVPRERWLRGVVERALESRRGSGLAEAAKGLASEREMNTAAPAPAEQPETTPEVRRRYGVTMASQAREFRPYPKGG